MHVIFICIDSYLKPPISKHISLFRNNLTFFNSLGTNENLTNNYLYYTMGSLSFESHKMTSWIWPRMTELILVKVLRGLISKNYTEIQNLITSKASSIQQNK